MDAKQFFLFKNLVASVFGDSLTIGEKHFTEEIDGAIECEGDFRPVRRSVAEKRRDPDVETDELATSSFHC